MSTGNAKIDQNFNDLLTGVSSDDGTTPVRVEVNPATGGVLVDSDELQPTVDYDYLDVQQTDADTETYIFKTGGAGGITIRTIVINYTSSTKVDIDNVTWS